MCRKQIYVVAGMGVGERTAMEGLKQHFIGDASDVKEMKTNEDKTAVVCWF